jgi:6-phosphogluconolactonase
MSHFDTRVTEDPAGEAAERLAAAAEAGAHIALAGGSTPRAAYERVAAMDVDWSGATLWYGDERCVPPDHEWSNYGMAKRALLDRLDEPPTAVHRIEGELGADEAARRYDQEVRGVSFDLVLLGLGSDGHAASLFPQAPALLERERRAVAAEAKLEPFVDRVTLTIPPLESATLLVWLVAGEGKAEAAARAFAGEPDPDTPASLIRSKRGDTLAILDREAASLLSV